MIRRFKTTHWIYILAHALVFIGGVVLLVVGPIGPVPRAILQAVGTALVAAAMAGWILFVYVLVADDVRRQLELVTKAGFVSAFDARAARIKDEYDQRLRNAQKNIDVMGFGLGTLREDYSADFASWAHRAAVRILLIDPEYPDSARSYAKQRDSEEGNANGRTAQDVRALIANVRSVNELARNANFKVRLYRCLPSINIFRVDDEIFWGPYLARTQSRNTPTFVVTRGGFLFDRLVSHFDQIWNDSSLSREVPSSWLDS